MNGRPRLSHRKHVDDRPSRSPGAAPAPALATTSLQRRHRYVVQPPGPRVVRSIHPSSVIRFEFKTAKLKRRDATCLSELPCFFVFFFEYKHNSEDSLWWCWEAFETDGGVKAAEGRRRLHAGGVNNIWTRWLSPLDALVVEHRLVRLQARGPHHGVAVQVYEFEKE